MHLGRGRSCEAVTGSLASERPGWLTSRIGRAQKGRCGARQAQLLRGRSQRPGIRGTGPGRQCVLDHHLLPGTRCSAHWLGYIVCAHTNSGFYTMQNRARMGGSCSLKVDAHFSSSRKQVIAGLHSLTAGMSA